MIEALGGIFGGLGLFFVGMWLLTENLKALANRRFRMAAANLVPNRFAALALGGFAGSVSQSTSALTFVTVGMLRAGLISAERAFAVMLGGNVGVALIILFVLLDIRLLAYYVGGVAGILVVTQSAPRLRQLILALFGLTMLFGGLSLMQESAMSISSHSWVGELLDNSLSSYWLSFLVAAVLTFVLQSAVVVIVFGMTIASAGVLSADAAHEIDHLIMYILGAHIGSNFILLALSSGLTGASRRVAMFQVLFNFVLCGIFVPLFYIEVLTGAPLLKTLVENIDLALEKQLAIYIILLQALTGIPFITFLGPVGRIYARLWPDSPTESLSRTLYIQDRDYVGVDASVQLAVLEQRRVLTAFSSYLDRVRQRGNITQLRDSTGTLIREISEFLGDLSRRHPGQSSETVNSVLSRQRLIIWLEEGFAEFCQALNELPDDEAAEQLRDVMVDGIDTVLLTIIDTLSEPEGQAMFAGLAGSRAYLMRRIRNDYAPDGASRSDAGQASILRVTSTAGEIFFLLSRFIQEMDPAASPVSPD